MAKFLQHSDIITKDFNFFSYGWRSFWSLREQKLAVCVSSVVDSNECSKFFTSVWKLISMLKLYYCPWNSFTVHLHCFSLALSYQWIRIDWEERIKELFFKVNQEVTLVLILHWEQIGLWVASLMNGMIQCKQNF